MPQMQHDGLRTLRAYRFLAARTLVCGMRCVKLLPLPDVDMPSILQVYEKGLSKAHKPAPLSMRFGRIRAT